MNILKLLATKLTRFPYHCSVLISIISKEYVIQFFFIISLNYFSRTFVVVCVEIRIDKSIILMIMF